MQRKIAIVNRSTVVPAEEFCRAVAAVQRQVWDDFAPAWGLTAALLSAWDEHPEGEMIAVLDDADQAGYLGYHEESGGSPRGFVFARTDKMAGENWSATLSHEVLEQLADPYANLVSYCGLKLDGDDSVGWSYEAADPVENDEYEITVGGVAVPVSNFVLPTWFVPDAPPPYDHLGKLTRPGQLSPGGYAAVLVGGREWRQQFGNLVTEKQRAAHAMSRRGRRFGGG